MGSWYLFSCPKCGYEAEVSGGPDWGEAARTHTISCATCRELHDSLVGMDAHENPPAPLPEKLVCPRSRTRVHDTRLWEHPGPCPRCGEGMERGPETTLWD
jgi:predicted RNA-binding Zn-ribbon protein involved in translation (DUF1610 family)